MSLRRSKCDLLLAPKVQHIGLLSWRSFEEAMAAGYEAATENPPELERLCGSG
jgi:predicted acylesterase/phospholipase RssA